MMKHFKQSIIIIMILLLCGCSFNKDDKIYTKDALEMFVKDSVILGDEEIFYYVEYKDMDAVIGYLKQEYPKEIKHIEETYGLGEFSRFTVYAYCEHVGFFDGKNMVDVISALDILENKEYNIYIDKLIKKYKRYENQNNQEGMQEVLDELKANSPFEMYQIKN